MITTIHTTAYSNVRVIRPQVKPVTATRKATPSRLDIVAALETGLTGLVMVAALLFAAALLRGVVPAGTLRDLGLDVLDITTALTGFGSIVLAVAGLFRTNK